MCMELVGPSPTPRVLRLVPTMCMMARMPEHIIHPSLLIMLKLDILQLVLPIRTMHHIILWSGVLASHNLFVAISTMI